jgi:hypothetical protein
VEEAEAGEELLEPVADAVLPEAEAEVLLLPPVTASHICLETVWVSVRVVSDSMYEQSNLGLEAERTANIIGVARACQARGGIGNDDILLAALARVVHGIAVSSAGSSEEAGETAGRQLGDERGNVS